jgi:hypothetical protein
MENKTYIVHHRGRTDNDNYRALGKLLGRYKVGARNEKEAEDFVKEMFGKYAIAKVYYEEKIDLVTYQTVIKEN